MLISNIVLKAFNKAIRVLEKENIDWCLFGGLAMQVYKRIRATRDVDLMITVTSDRINEFISQMRKAGFKFDSKRGVIKLNNFELFRFIYIDEDTGVEIFIDLATVKTEFQKQILDRKIKTDFLGIETNIASLEDIIILKLLADRPIDSLDVQVLLEENKKDIDKDYLKNWGKRLGINDRLKELFQQKRVING